MPPTQKRIAETAATTAKKIKTGQALAIPEPTVVSSSSTSTNTLKDRFIALLTQSEYATAGISNSTLKKYFPDEEYLQLVPIINELTATSRLVMSRTAKELHYTLVEDQVALQFVGLDPSARMVYQVIERTQTMGCWTKDIRLQTNIQQNALTKILKTLESRRLIKPVKSVTAKSKKLYMLYDLQPSKELTGGVWYSNLEFDHEFISKLRYFLVQTCRKRPHSLAELHHELEQKEISNVALSLEDVRQLVQTLVLDYSLEEEERGPNEEAVFGVPRKVSVPCEFTWWEAIEPDFGFRTVVFEDGVLLAPHEPHYQTA
ncbi:DNA-directed RNA polymerase III subunit RPC6 [Fistulifera solaris]|uniref:DNA-directed RNA polymerase III subunit RPC6 n=1 Tax=Fistulifera solaris TaxID=1519565 RepID=A0A1Z5JUL6_FISSO|nr:DNA-directed RNA polymerase III subunit RPC6 [Fistulifera solaris]|eukprot:GAX17733.1 DNA-directed RNA polymerase III subunit RPC6 [Fistulifera solaris]